MLHHYGMQRVVPGMERGTQKKFGVTARRALATTSELVSAQPQRRPTPVVSAKSSCHVGFGQLKPLFPVLPTHMHRFSATSPEKAEPLQDYTNLLLSRSLLKPLAF